MSSETTLFAHIVLNHTGQVEVLAVEALGHILSQSEAARNALEDMVKTGGAEIDSIVRVQTQDTEEGARPDLVAYDDDRAARVVIEAKFMAGLTENQPNQYLKRLPQDTPSTLLFIAPASKLETLWQELRERAGKEFTLIAVQKTGKLRSAALDGGVHHLQLISWAALLKSMESRALKAGDSAADADIRQLRGLTDRMDAEAFLPWLPEDLEPEFAMRMLNLITLVDDATNRGCSKDAGFLNIDGLKKSPRYEGYGRHIRIGGVEAWFGYIFDGWARHGRTPLWLLFNYDKHEELKQAGLTDKAVDFSWRLCLPIEFPTGEEYSDLLDSVVASLRNIAEQLDPPGPGTPEGEE